MLLCLLLLCGCSGNDALEEWSRFKAACMSRDGRIIDWQNGGRSHSEGQGYAMLLSLRINDRPAFDLAFSWSERNLGPGLKAWSWGEKNGSWGILSSNNATDGDMLHAWALFLAGERWNEPLYTREGAALLARIRERLIACESVIIPGLEGFTDADGITVNPSYYIFPALEDFARFDPEYAHLWENVRRKGLALIRESVNPRTGLVPDWVRCNAGGSFLPPDPDAVSGYEAMRVPLYLAMNRERETLEMLRPLILRAARTGRLPDRMRLDGDAASDQEMLAGGYAALARAASVLEMGHEADVLWDLAKKYNTVQEGNYYGTVLFLLSLLG